MPPAAAKPIANATTDATVELEAGAAAQPSHSFSPNATELRETRRYLPHGTSEEQAAFAERQLRARSRTTLLIDFYRRYPCHLADLHLLAACAVTLGRFRGFSPEFDEMGEEFMIAGKDGAPRTAAWRHYAEACEAGRPWETRDELWIAAHMEDMERVRESGLAERFHRQSALHADDPTWQAIQQHVDATLGTRLMDRIALDGSIAYETAFAHSLSATFFRLCTVSWHMVRRYYWEGFRAVFEPDGESREGIASYRRLALKASRYCITAWNASRVYRRGMRERDRGRRTSEDGWPLLADVLGPRVSEVDPLIVKFYQNPAKFQVRVRVDLHTLPARLWSRVITLLIGQGPYAESGSEVDAQFRVFRRRDGSMHFLRELYMGETLRVFDSDFVVRAVNGVPTLFEVFVDKHIEVEMTVTPLPDGGVNIRGKNFYYRGLRLPCPGLRVEFQSHVQKDPDLRDMLNIEGRLLMQPDSGWGRVLMCRLLRRPEVLGTIRYVARPLAAAEVAPENNSFS
ncbi:MAG TPA: hypothetical protein VNW47_11490 [Terriglobales bacterium]|nr:hypothetical protein [Terriglobales bacterium]